MSTLDSLVHEVIRRTQAAGGKSAISEDASTETKLAFLRAMSLEAHRKE